MPITLTRSSTTAVAGVSVTFQLSANLALAVEIASLPEQIRGYGQVKDLHLRAAKMREKELLARFDAPSVKALAAVSSEDKVAA